MSTEPKISEEQAKEIAINFGQSIGLAEFDEVRAYLEDGKWWVHLYFVDNEPGLPSSALIIVDAVTGNARSLRSL